MSAETEKRLKELGAQATAATDQNEAERITCEFGATLQEHIAVAKESLDGLASIILLRDSIEPSLIQPNTPQVEP